MKITVVGLLLLLGGVLVGVFVARALKQRNSDPSDEGIAEPQPPQDETGE